MELPEVTVTETLNRNKNLDEAIFLMICGRNMIKEDNNTFTSVVRLEMAQHLLEMSIRKAKEIQKLKEESYEKTKTNK